MKWTSINDFFYFSYVKPGPLGQPTRHHLGLLPVPKPQVMGSSVLKDQEEEVTPAASKIHILSVRRDRTATGRRGGILPHTNIKYLWETSPNS